MKVLVASKGDRHNDFGYTREGELVQFPFVCDRNNPDCGCDRMMGGLETSLGTTVVKVVEVRLAHEELTRLVSDALLREGWTKESPSELGRERANHIISEASAWNVGTELGIAYSERTGRQYLIPR